MGTVPWFEVPLQARCKLFWNWIIGSSVWDWEVSACHICYTPDVARLLCIRISYCEEVYGLLSPGEDCKNSPLVTDVGQIQLGVRHFRGCLSQLLVNKWSLTGPIYGHFSACHIKRFAGDAELFHSAFTQFTLCDKLDPCAVCMTLYLALRFPGGIPKLARYMHDRGLKLGIYGDMGTHTCGGYPGTPLDKIELDAQTFAAWEVDMFKFDGCYSNAVEQETGKNTRSVFSLQGLLRILLIWFCLTLGQVTLSCPRL